MKGLVNPGDAPGVWQVCRRVEGCASGLAWVGRRKSLGSSLRGGPVLRGGPIHWVGGVVGVGMADRGVCGEGGAIGGVGGVRWAYWDGGHDASHAAARQRATARAAARAAVSPAAIGKPEKRRGRGRRGRCP